MRKDIVAMKIMEMVFQHNFGWGREGNLINHGPSLSLKKKKNTKRNKRDFITGPWELPTSEFSGFFEDPGSSQ